MKNRDWVVGVGSASAMLLRAWVTGMACVLGCVWLSSCGGDGVPTVEVPDELPSVPLAITVSEPASAHNGQDLASLSAGELAYSADALYEDGQHAAAATLLHWAIRKGGSGHYNLACYYALAGDIDNGFYWLQQAALEEGVDPKWAHEDDDLVLLRADERWSVVSTFLAQVSAYWVHSGHTVTRVVVPQGTTPTTELPIVMWLHGYGADPNMVLDYQELSNELGVALVGVSATMADGPMSFRWSEDLKQDQARIEAALKEVRSHFIPKPGKIALIANPFPTATKKRLSASLHLERGRGSLRAGVGAA